MLNTHSELPDWHHRRRSHGERRQSACDALQRPNAVVQPAAQFGAGDAGRSWVSSRQMTAWLIGLSRLAGIMLPNFAVSTKRVGFQVQPLSWSMMVCASGDMGAGRFSVFAATRSRTGSAAGCRPSPSGMPGGVAFGFGAAAVVGEPCSQRQRPASVEVVAPSHAQHRACSRHGIDPVIPEPAMTTTHARAITRLGLTWHWQATTIPPRLQAGQEP